MAKQLKLCLIFVRLCVCVCLPATPAAVSAETKLSFSVDWSADDSGKLACCSS